MRDSQRATIFLKGGKPHYDTELGKMVGGKSIVKTLPCFISDTGLTTTNLLSDKKGIASKTIRFNLPVEGIIDYVVVDGLKYNVLNKKGYYSRRETIFVELKPSGGVRWG